jgi:hypothetical protein
MTETSHDFCSSDASAGQGLRMGVVVCHNSSCLVVAEQTGQIKHVIEH